MKKFAKLSSTGRRAIMASARPVPNRTLMVMPNVTGVQKSRRISLAKKVLFSAMTTVAFFCMLEVVLSLLGVAPVTVSEDPFVGFSSQVPLMQVSVDPDGKKIVTTAENKLVWFNAQSFPLEKKARTQRVFCMGGSTTYGHPYWDSTSFPRWLREFLPLVDSSHQWEVINAGGISYASYRVAALMQELAQYQPDLFVVYSVHNEFLERRTYAGMFDKQPLLIRTQSALARTRTWAMIDFALRKLSPANPVVAESDSPNEPRQRDILPAEVDEILNHSIGPVDYHRDPAWQASVLRHYETNFERMVGIARRCGAKIIFITPASNEKNCSPFKSEFLDQLDNSAPERCLELLQQARTEANDDNPNRAIELLNQAALLDSEYAELHFRLGQCLFEVKKYDEAQQAFSRALNADICPLRAPSGITAALRRVSKRTNVPLVDFEARLREKCANEQGHSVFGDEYFLDHVHPTVEINRQLALWIIDEMLAKKLVRGKSPESPVIQDRIRVVSEQVLSEMDDKANGIALRNLAKVIHWAGKFEEAATLAKNAMQLIPDDPESRFVLADCLKNLGQYDEAINEYDKLFAGATNFPKANNRFGELLAFRGHFRAAKVYLMMGVLEDPRNPYAQFLLAKVHFEMAEYEFAEQCAAEANRLEPKNATTLYLLARSNAALSKFHEAIAFFEQTSSVASGDAEFYNYYGLALLYAKRPHEAVAKFEVALELNSNYEEARKNLHEAMSHSK